MNIDNLVFGIDTAATLADLDSKFSAQIDNTTASWFLNEIPRACRATGGNRADLDHGLLAELFRMIVVGVISHGEALSTLYWMLGGK